MPTNPHLGVFDMPYSDREIIEEILTAVEESLGPQPRLTLPQGTTLTVRGKPVTHVTFVLDGSVALTHDSIAAGTVILHEASTGRVIGLMSLTEGGSAQNTALTTSEITCVQITFDQFKRVIEQRRTSVPTNAGSDSGRCGGIAFQVLK